MPRVYGLTDAIKDVRCPDDEELVVIESHGATLQFSGKNSDPQLFGEDAAMHYLATQRDHFHDAGFQLRIVNTDEERSLRLIAQYYGKIVLNHPLGELYEETLTKEFRRTVRQANLRLAAWSPPHSKI